MFLAVELLADGFKAAVDGDFRTSEAEVDVEAVFNRIVDLVLDDVERGDEGLFAELAASLGNAFGNGFDIDRMAEGDIGFIAFTARQVAFANTDISYAGNQS